MTKKFVLITVLMLGVVVSFCVSSSYTYGYYWCIPFEKHATSLNINEESYKTISAQYPIEETDKIINLQKINELKSDQRVEEIIPVAEFKGEVLFDDKPTLIIPVYAVPPSYFELENILPKVGSIYAQETNGAIFSIQALKYFGFPIDQTVINKEVTINIYYENKNGDTRKITNLRLKIVGINPDENESPIIYFSNSLIKEYPEFKNVLIKMKSVEVTGSFINKLENDGFLTSSHFGLLKYCKDVFLKKFFIYLILWIFILFLFYLVIKSIRFILKLK